MKENIPSRKGRAITVGEIARLAGVSRSSASAVLNGKSSVRESTRAKVLECIRRENFQPGIVAKSMVLELSHMVTVLAADPGSPYDMMVFQGIASVLRRESYNVLFHVVEHEDWNSPNPFAGLNSVRSAGYIMLGANGGEQAKQAQRWLDEGIPLVIIGLSEGLDTHMVTLDYRNAMKAATDYVIRKGHRRLAHFGGSPQSLGAREREIGFIEALVEHGIPLSTATIMRLGLSPEAEREAAIELLRDPVRRPTAVTCFNDMLAINIYQAARELSLRIPEDISVVGFDGTYLAELLGPPLTTMDIFPKRLGEKSAQMLLKVIRNQAGRGLVKELSQCQLREGASVRAL